MLDVYRTNKRMHFQQILRDEGFKLTSEGKPRELDRQVKEEAKNITEEYNEELFDEYLKSENRGDAKFQNFNVNAQAVGLITADNETLETYKELIMESQAEAARQVRKYYICLEDLFTQYLLYQQAYQTVLSTNRFEILTIENKELSNKLDQLIVQNETQSQTLVVQTQQLETQS